MAAMRPENWPAKWTRGVRNVPKLNPDFVALWKPCLEEGMSYKHVAEMFGVSKGSVRNAYPGMGWTMEQAREMGTFMKHHNQRMRKSAFATQA